MKISEMIDALKAMQNTWGDVEVFCGTFYRDYPIKDIVIEDGYPLVLCDEEITF